MMKLWISFIFLFPAFLFTQEYVIKLGGMGSIRYILDNTTLLRIERLEPNGELLYAHTYNYDENGNLISESLIGGLGDIVYEKSGAVRSPYHVEIRQYDEQRRLIKHAQGDTIREYAYNDSNELISPNSLETCIYDADGNLIQKGDTSFHYDQSHRLLSASLPGYEISFTYDAEGRRDSKTVNGEKEQYIYLGKNEMLVAKENGALIEMRIPGLSFHSEMIRPIAIETSDAIYAPIHNLQGNIIKLVNIFTKEVISLNLADPFGRNLSKDAPTSWIFAGKNYDSNLDLVYFGHRFYCPELKKWITPDPSRQTADLYQYCFNNPFLYFDPDGRWTVAIPLIEVLWGASSVITAPIWGTGAIAIATGVAVGYASYKGVQYANDWLTTREHAILEQKFAEQGFFADRMTKSDGAPRRSDDQNKQFEDAKKEIERSIGRKLTKDESNKFHQQVSGHRYNYQELVQEGKVIFHGK